ncbi:hypothetical protein COOONC_19340 [Cooperia oncophora]
MTKAIGYPRILSLENFRTPNFRLVAELLEWIVKRFDPSATISAEHTTTEQERVLFIKQAVLLLLQNSRLRLNPRRLYQVRLDYVQNYNDFPFLFSVVFSKCSFRKRLRSSEMGIHEEK